MKNKKRGSDETWLPKGPGQRILSSTPRGIPPLVRPGTKKLLPIKDLEAGMKKCKCLAHEDRQWWSSFILAEKAFCTKWEAASAKFLSEDKRAEWHLNKLQRHRPIKKATTTDRDQCNRRKPWMIFLGKQTISHKRVRVLVLNAQMWSFVGFLYRHCDIQHSNPVHLGSKATIDSIGKIRVSGISIKVKINELLKQYQINKTNNHHMKMLSSCPFNAIQLNMSVKTLKVSHWHITELVE